MDINEEITSKITKYLYTYTCHEDERSLCQLELRTLFGSEPEDKYIISEKLVDESRSPFIKSRMSILYEGHDLHQILENLQHISLVSQTFKVVYLDVDKVYNYEEKRAIERETGMYIRGKADMRDPDIHYGITSIGGKWLFGTCSFGEALWLHHMQKPQQYSTALSTRLARSIVNIAVPDLGPELKMIDPCCGIGTVIIEALSMGIDVVGYDINVLAVRGARMNLAHFGFPDVVKLGDIHQLAGGYDVLVLDMPYNLCSKLSDEEQNAMLLSARRLAARAVIVTTEAIEGRIRSVGFKILDHCIVKKGHFQRFIVVCE